MNNKYYQWGAIVLVGVIAVWSLFATRGIRTNGTISLGGTTGGNMLAENYIPYVQYNGGYNSAKDINTSAFLGGTGTFQFGSSGTTFTRFNTGTCYIAPYSTTITASTTGTVDCQATQAVGAPTSLAISALTGVTSGDVVQAQLSTSSSIISGTAAVGWGSISISGAAASTTAGYITLIIQNNTGTTFTWPTKPVGGVNATGTVSYIITK